jgi:hypothetical protein
MSLFSLDDISNRKGKDIAFGSIEVMPGQIIGPVNMRSIRKAFDGLEFGKASGAVFPYWTNNHWSTYDLLMYMVAAAGASEVTFQTWGLGKQAVELIDKAIKSGAITSCFAVFDKTLKQRKSNILAQARLIIPNIGFTEVHGKSFTVQSSTHSITAITTSNMTKNRRLEFGVIFTQEDVCNQFADLAKEVCHV